MNRRDALVTGLLLAVLAGAVLPFARLELNPHHDGVMLKPALDVLAGQTLFRDTFTQYGALTTYLQTAALWIHPSLLALRLQTIAAYAIALVFFQASWRLVLPRGLAFVSSVLFILFIPANEPDYWQKALWPLLPWSSVFALVFQSLALYALLQIIRGEAVLRQGLILGAATAAAFWCRQPVGGLMAGCLVIIWLALRRTGWVPAEVTPRALIVRVLAGFAGIHALLLGSIVISGAWSEWWDQNIAWPARWSGAENWHDTLVYCVNPGRFLALLALLAAASLPAFVKKFRPALSRRVWLVYYLGLGAALIWQRDWTLGVLAIRGGGWAAVLPALVIIQAVISATLVFTRGNSVRDPEYHLVASLAAFSLVSLVQYYPTADPWHVVWALGPAFGLVTYSLWRWSGWPAPVLGLVLIGVFLPSTLAKVQSTRRALAQPLVTLSVPAALQGMRVTPVQARSYESIAATLALVAKQAPDLPAVLVGQDALFLCFMPNLANGTPYYVTWAGLAPETDNARRVAYIQRVRPLVFFQRANWEGVNSFYRTARYVPLVYVPDEALEIAVPQEVADAMRLKAYGATPAEAATPSR